MAVFRCDNGHFYDNTKFPECPHCKNETSLVTRQELNEGRTMFLPSDHDASNAGEKQKVRIDMGGKEPADEKTVGIYRSEKGCDPVVGWLVCTKGGEKGRDYRLHAGRNFIGRGLKSDVSLPDDAQVSRDNHCSIIFEPKKSTYAIVSGVGELYVNGEFVQESHLLSDDEVISIGSSEFIFIPYCKEGRSW